MHMARLDYVCLSLLSLISLHMLAWVFING